MPRTAAAVTRSLSNAGVVPAVVVAKCLAGKGGPGLGPSPWRIQRCQGSACASRACRGWQRRALRVLDRLQSRSNAQRPLTPTGWLGRSAPGGKVEWRSLSPHETEETRTPNPQGP